MNNSWATIIDTHTHTYTLASWRVSLSPIAESSGGRPSRQSSRHYWGTHHSSLMTVIPCVCVLLPRCAYMLGYLQDYFLFSIELISYCIFTTACTCIHTPLLVAPMCMYYVNVVCVCPILSSPRECWACKVKLALVNNHSHHSLPPVVTLTLVNTGIGSSLTVT